MSDVLQGLLVIWNFCYHSPLICIYLYFLFSYPLISISSYVVAVCNQTNQKLLHLYACHELLSSAFDTKRDSKISNYILSIPLQAEIWILSNGVFGCDTQILEYCSFSHVIQGRSNDFIEPRLVSDFWTYSTCCLWKVAAFFDLLNFPFF